MSTQEATMTTEQVAERLVELCSMGQFNEAQDELYADHCTSIEPEHSMSPTVEGLDAIREKGKNFQSMIKENHGGYVNEPIIAGNHFALQMGMDATMQDGNRMNVDEIAVYKVDNGKIVSEQFFF